MKNESEVYGWKVSSWFIGDVLYGAFDNQHILHKFLSHKQIEDHVQYCIDHNIHPCKIRKIYSLEKISK